MSAVEPILDESPGRPAVRGYLHHPFEAAARGALVLAHGAGSNANAPLLIAVATVFAEAGLHVLRCDLPFRQLRPHGPPMGTGAQDRAGLCRAVEVMRALVLVEAPPGRIFIGGHSYGGRQASMLAAEDPAVAAGVVLFSYPLHPPKRPAQLRTAHFPNLRTPALFVHGTRDPFGSLDEMRQALGLIPVACELLPVEGAGHDLARGRGNVARDALTAFRKLVDPLAQAL
jgi:uncharacterized protein